MGATKHLFTIDIPGYRRVPFKALPIWVVDEAISFLKKSVLGDTKSLPHGFALGSEEHWNEKEGRHRGVSVFIEETRDLEREKVTPIEGLETVSEGGGLTKGEVTLIVFVGSLLLWVFSFLLRG